jgi:hypothetical protein
MINAEVLELSINGKNAQAIFKTSIHQRLFNILLVDFLSKSAGEITGRNISSLDALVEICVNPMFNENNSVKSLRAAVKRFKKWLEREIAVEVWFPSISLNASLNVQRKEFITICGDISKHSFSRLGRRARDLMKIFERSGGKVTMEEALILLDEFYERFHTDIFSYHASHLVEQLNDITWGIKDYLQPQLPTSVIRVDATLPRYRYVYPDGLNTEFAKHCYRNLMNEISITPHIKKFRTHKSLKASY